MYLKDICQLFDYECNEDIKIKKIKLNSKEVKKGDLFVAINKGHNYIDEAIKRGAIAVISEKKQEYKVLNIVVESSILALGKIANHIRNLFDIPLIAITGSCGKTTTKDLVSLILSKKYKVLKSEKNKNNNIGLPQTLLNLNNNYDIVVTELGMNHFNEISYLSNICKPDYAIITNIGSAHIGNLGSKKNILKAKLEILDGMNGGPLIINKDDPYLKKIKYHNLVKINAKKLNVKNIKYYYDRIEFDIDDVHFQFNVPFKHILIDLFLAIKMGLILNIDLKLISEAIMEYKSSDGRLEIKNDKYLIINDSYNSNYEALIGGLQLLKNDKRFKIIILGDMLELGKYSIKYHKKINRYLRKIKNKKVLLIGEYTKYIKGMHFAYIEQINKFLKQIVVDDCVIYIKGSHAMNLDKIKTRFD